MGRPFEELHAKVCRELRSMGGLIKVPRPTIEQSKSEVKLAQFHFWSGVFRKFAAPLRGACAF